MDRRKIDRTGGIKLKKFQLEDLSMDQFYYIVHLLDKVLVGEFSIKDTASVKQFTDVKGAIENDTVLEAHFFNSDQEIFVAQVEGELMMYAPLVHKQDTENSIDRFYELEHLHNKSKWMPYKALHVKEYISYDEQTHLAYIDKTILVSLR